MMVKVNEVSDRLLHFIENSPKNILETDAIVLSNDRWNLHLDYNGENPEKALDSIRILANYKKKLMKNFVASETPGQILNTARDFADFFNYRNFTISVSAKNNFLWGLVLRAHIFFARFF